MIWLVTGGAGYIGGRVVRRLREAGHTVVVFDDLSTGLRARVPSDVTFVRGAVTDYQATQAVFSRFAIQGVVHLAARKSVSESVLRPEYYWQENVGGLSTLLSVMHQAGVRRLLFSSSAAVYGHPTSEVVDERAKTMPINPYGHTKLVGESLIRRAGESPHCLSWMVLRHFNVAGSIGPLFVDRSRTGLLPNIFRALTGGPTLAVMGASYPTRDGTGVRDYVHVDDVARAYASAVKFLSRRQLSEPYGQVINVGSGMGRSVQEVIAEVEKVTNRPVPRRVLPKRPGDAPVIIADPHRATTILEWKAERGLQEMVKTGWQAWLGSTSGPVQSALRFVAQDQDGDVVAGVFH
jgi:UDP-glucose 4-epimerase